MRLTVISAVLSLGILAGCSDWPDVEVTDGAAPLGPWPQLQPLEASGVVLADDDPAFAFIERRAAQLRLRASLLRAPVTDQESFDRLRARMAR